MVLVAGACREGGTRTRSLDPWTGAPRVDGPAVTIEHVPERWRVTYRVDLGTPLGSIRDTEVVAVERPLHSRVVTRLGAGDDGRLLDDRTATLGRLRVAGDRGTPAVLSVPPDLAGSDVRLDVELPTLLREGMLARRERRVVVGRPCQVYRSAAPLSAAARTRVTASSENYVDSCVDAAGLVLAQVRVVDGGPADRRIATRVEEAPTFTPGYFDVPEPLTLAPDDGGGNVVGVDPSTLPPGPSWFLDRPPDGFVAVGHYAVAVPAPTAPDGSPVGQRRGGFTDVWVRGPDVLLLDQGGTEFGAAPFDADPFGSPVDLGALGTGEAVPGSRLSAVRVRREGGRYVRLAGTLPVDRLAELARSLRRADR